MGITKKYKYKISDTNDISNLVELVLEKYNYPRDKIIHYTFLIEEALYKWKSEFDENEELEITQINHPKKMEYLFTIKGEKVDPFNVKVSEFYDMDKMTDTLLSGIGNELSYHYSNLTRSNTIKFKFPKTKINEGIFTTNLFILGIPVVIQAILEAIAVNINTFLLGFLDAASMSAVSLVTTFSNLILTSLVKDGIVALTLIAEYWGNRNRHHINQIITISLRFAIVASSIFALGSFVFANQIMSAYTNVPEIIEKGVQYIRIYCFSFVAYGLFKMAYSYMQALGHIKEVTTFTITGCICNIVLNALFIFGKFSWLPNSIVGAALATTLSYIIQMILGFGFLLKKKEFEFNIFRRVTINRKPFYKMYIVLFAQFMSWNLANNFIIAAYGHINIDAVSANSIVLIIYNIMSGFRGGYTTAASLLMCKSLGKENFEEAKENMQITMKASNSLYLAIAPIFLLAGFSLRFLPMDLSSKALYYTDFLTVIYCIKMFFTDKNNIINDCAINPGGDGRSVVIIDAIVMWGIMVPISLLIINGILNVDVLVILFLLNINEFSSFIIRYFRYKQYKWLKKVV